MADSLKYAIEVAGLFVLGCLGVYVLVRVGSVAYFKTKLEHFRTTMRELKGED